MLLLLSLGTTELEVLLSTEVEVLLSTKLEVLLSVADDVETWVLLL